MARASNLNCGDETAPSVSLDPYSFGDRPNQSVLNYLDKALPQVFRNYTPGATDTFQYRLLHEFKTHYRFSSLLFWSSVYSNGKPIYAVACQLILIVSFLFFLLALCFELQVSQCHYHDCSLLSVDTYFYVFIFVASHVGRR